MSSDSRATILIVEDEPLIRRLIRMALTEVGHTVLEAGNFGEALEAFRPRADAIDLVIMDLVMPGGSGLDVANELRTLRAELRILYITGYRNSMLSRCIAEGAPTAMLLKPFSAADLLTRVADLLRDGSTAAG